MTIGKLSGQCDFGQKGQSYCNQRGQSCVAKRVKVAWLFHPFLNWIMHLWLQGFTLHFGHGPAFWIFIVFVMVTVVALTIAWKIRAIIRVNPVEALRDE